MCKSIVAVFLPWRCQPWYFHGNELVSEYWRLDQNNVMMKLQLKEKVIKEWTNADLMTKVLRRLLPPEKEKDYCQVTREFPKAIELHY